MVHLGCYRFFFGDSQLVEQTDQQKQTHNLHHPQKSRDFEHPSKINIWKYNCLLHHFATCRIAPFNLLKYHVVTFVQKNKKPARAPSATPRFTFSHRKKKAAMTKFKILHVLWKFSHGANELQKPHAPCEPRKQTPDIPLYLLLHGDHCMDDADYNTWAV